MEKVNAHGGNGRHSVAGPVTHFATDLSNVTALHAARRMRGVQIVGIDWIDA